MSAELTPLEVANERSQQAFEHLKAAVDDYFAAKGVAQKLQHEQDCDDPECPTRVLQTEVGLESLSSFVVLAELTSITDGGATVTHTCQTFGGSAMSVLGLLTEAQAKLLQYGAE